MKEQIMADAGMATVRDWDGTIRTRKLWCHRERDSDEALRAEHMTRWAAGDFYQAAKDRGCNRLQVALTCIDKARERTEGSKAA